MACVVLCFSRGLKERKWKVLGVMTDGIQNNPINCSMNEFNGQPVTCPIHMISRPEPYVTSNYFPQNIGNTNLSYLNSTPQIYNNYRNAPINSNYTTQ